ncbi:MAG: LysR family transcriptional regulator [Planctomycetes bacterium]|nr:LysR family transcriptional regulator [Planctomycetota bacterium]
MSQSHRYKGLQFAQLRSFCLAATQGNFTSAAEALGLSKATVWQQVRSLERKLGVVLLRRSGRGVEVTTEGRLLLEMVQPHVNGLDSLPAWFAARREELPHSLSVASVPYLITHHLPEAVQSFVQTHPQVHLNLCAEPWLGVVGLVDQGEADLGVVPYPRDDPPSRNLEYEPLFNLRFHLMTSRNHPLVKKRNLTLADIAGYPLIQPQEGSFTRPALDHLLRTHKLTEKVRWVLVSRSVDMTRKYAALGVGVAMEYLGEQETKRMPDVHLRPFDAEAEPVPVALIVRRFSHLSATALAFRDEVRRHCAKSEGKAK